MGIEVLAREGEAAPGAGGATYGSVQYVGVSGSGNALVLQVKLSDGRTVFYREVDGGGLQLLEATGNSVTVGGVPRTIYGMGFYTDGVGSGGGGGGMGSAINDQAHVFAVLSLGSGDYVARVYRP